VRLTLRTKTALLTTSLVLLLVGATGGWQYRQLSNEYVSVMREQQQALTRIAAADLDYKLAMHLTVLARAARSADAQTFADPAAQRRFFVDSGLRPMFDGAALVRLDGMLIANDPPIDKPLNIADRDYFRRALDTSTPAISGPLLARATNQPAILMVAPALDAAGKPIGVVSAGLTLDRPNVLGAFARTSVGRGGHYVIVTRGPAPVFVVHPDPGLLLQPAALRADDDRDDNASRDLTTAAPIPSADWELRVVVPAATAYAPLEAARRALWLQMLALGLASAALVWAGTTWLMRPLATLHGAIRTLRQSPDSSVKLDLRANDERGDLAREFDALMSELKVRRTEMAAVTDASPLGLFRCDADGRMIYVNDAYLDIQGLARHEAADGWLTLLPETVRDKVRDDWKRIVSEPKPFQVSRWLRRRDGSDVLVSLRTQPIVIDGRVVGHVGTLSDISERTRAEQALRTLTAIFEATTDYVVQLDAMGRLTYMNPAARRRTGLALDAPIGHLTMADFNPPETLARLQNEVAPVARAKGVWVGESVIWDAAHRMFPVSHMVIAHLDRNGKVERYSGIMRDISAQREAESALRESEARLRTVADALPMRVAYIDATERYRFNNLAYERGFGLSREAIQGRTVRELLGEGAYASVEEHIRTVLRGQPVTFQSEMTKGDAYVCYEAQYIPQFAADGSSVVGFHAVVTDVTRQKREERRLLQLARVDPLTGLGNRAAFELRLPDAISRSTARGSLMALMYLDIDRFKQINDRWGHQTGDALLKAFAGRLAQTMRSTDFVARLGGDEFTLIMEDLPRREVAAVVADKIVRTMREAFALEEQTVRITASIGVALYGGGTAMTAETLIRQADEMLYQAKAAGRDNYQLAPAEVSASDAN